MRAPSRRSRAPVRARARVRTAGTCADASGAVDCTAVNLAAVTVWVARVAWAVAGVVGWTAVDQATDGRTAAVRAVASGGAAAIWLTGVAGLAVAGVVTLTLARTIVPLGVPVAAVSWVAGADAAVGAGTLVAAALAALAVATGEFGQRYVQASAYGHEQRFPLRPPPAFLLAATLAWGLAAAGLSAGPLLTASEAWLAGVPVTAAGVAVAVFAWPRWYRLARRWLVVVPAGVVVHDHLVLAETAMVPKADVASATLAPVGTAAADLTGPAPGHPIEVRLHRSTTVILAATPRSPNGTAIHLTAFLVAPTRPGRALAALNR